jgi:hypothetical protein
MIERGDPSRAAGLAMYAAAVGEGLEAAERRHDALQFLHGEMYPSRPMDENIAILSLVRQVGSADDVLREATDVLRMGDTAWGDDGQTAKRIGDIVTVVCQRPDRNMSAIGRWGDFLEAVEHRLMNPNIVISDESSEHIIMGVRWAFGAPDRSGNINPVGIIHGLWSAHDQETVMNACMSLDARTLIGGLAAWATGRTPEPNRPVRQPVRPIPVGHTVLQAPQPADPHQHAVRVDAQSWYDGEFGIGSYYHHLHLLYISGNLPPGDVYMYSYLRARSERERPQPGQVYVIC